MNKLYSTSLQRLSAYVLCICLSMCCVNVVKAQMSVTTSSSAATLAAALVGSGVTLISPTLTCPTSASGTYTVTSGFPIATGVVLTNGTAETTAGAVGVDIIDGGVASDFTDFASTDHSAAGDADLTALAPSGSVTHDACVLEFDFKAAGDTIRFNYVFGSEEYNGFICSEFDDVFGFFISGPGYAGATNIALVPGTSIPVSINSINCGATYAFDQPTCDAITGPGSPYCSYFVDNSEGTVVTYDGLTTVLTAIARVNPCDTYHLKLGVADVGDGNYDSGVFIAGG